MVIKRVLRCIFGMKLRGRAQNVGYEADEKVMKILLIKRVNESVSKWFRLLERMIDDIDW